MPPTYFISGHQFQHPLVGAPSDTPSASTDVPTRALLGVRPDAVVFACFNHLNRIDGPIWRAWLRILHAVPSSVLWLQVLGASACLRLRGIHSPPHKHTRGATCDPIWWLRPTCRVIRKAACGCSVTHPSRRASSGSACA